MAKKITRIAKVQAIGGAANPAPPLGPVLGGLGINIGLFISQFNAETANRRGEIVPVKVTVFDDRSFTLEYGVAPMSQLILKQIGQEKGSGKNLTKRVGKLTKDQIRAVAEQKLSDLNTDDINSAMRTVEGTARSMGVDVAA